MKFQINQRGWGGALSICAGIIIILSVIHGKYCQGQGRDTETEQRINAGNFMWNVAVGLSETDGFKFLCGGVLASSEKVVTSASCFDPEKILVRGENGSLHRVESVTQHPNYTRGNLYDDIAALKLKHPWVKAKKAALRTFNLQNHYNHHEKQLVTEWNMMLGLASVDEDDSETTSKSISKRQLRAGIRKGTIIHNKICEKTYKEYFILNRLKYKFAETFSRGIDSSLICVSVPCIPECERIPGYQLIIPTPLTSLPTVPTPITDFDFEIQFLAGTRFEAITTTNKTDCQYNQLPIIFTNLSPHRQWLANLQ